MKILRVRLENLNSLRGEHEVAFDAEPIAGAGIFAITGQTGAGKSTLLDAITLAPFHVTWPAITAPAMTATVSEIRLMINPWLARAR